MADFRPFFAVASNLGRRDRLLDKRQIEDSRVVWQLHGLFFIDDLKGRDILAERKPRTVHDHKVSQLEQPAETLPRLDFLVHIGPDDEKELGTRIRCLHRFQRLHGIPSFESIHFYCRRSKPFYGNGRQRDHRKAMKRRGYPSRLFMGWRKRRDEMDLINMEGFSDRMSSGEMSVMDGIEGPTQYRNPHASGPILALFYRLADFFRVGRRFAARSVNHSGSCFAGSPL